MKRGEVAY
jgi:hypothetical protein